MDDTSLLTCWSCSRQAVVVSLISSFAVRDVEPAVSHFCYNATSCVPVTPRVIENRVIK